MRTSFRLMAAGLILLAGAATARAEEPRIFRSEYVVSLYGVVLARSAFDSSFDGKNFVIEGALSSAGIARIFDDTTGSTSVTGHLAGGEIRPDSYVVDYVSGSKKKLTRIAFRNGAVASAENRPAVNTKREGWVPVRKGDLADVSDPLSATLVRAASPDEVCKRTIRVFDGAMRANIHLSPAGTSTISTKGYEGETVVCRARFEPVSGYRRGHSSIAFVRDRSEIMVAFAPIAETGVYAPVELSATTKIGTVKVQARRFEVSS